MLRTAYTLMHCCEIYLDREANFRDVLVRQAQLISCQPGDRCAASVILHEQNYPNYNSPPLLLVSYSGNYPLLRFT